jgi:hypothetical protein
LLLYPPAPEKQETTLTLVREEPAMSFADEAKALPPAATLAPALPVTAVAPTVTKDSFADADTATRARRPLEPAEQAAATFGLAPSEASKDKSAVVLDTLAENDSADSMKQVRPSALRSSEPASSQPAARLAFAPSEPAPAGVAKELGRATGDLRMEADAERKPALAEKKAPELARAGGASGGNTLVAKPESNDTKVELAADGSFGRAYFKTETASPPASFARQDSLGALSGAKPSAQLPVLASFQFEQSGSEIRIVDADGSVYSGTGTYADAALPLAATDSRRTQSSPRAAGNSYGGAKAKMNAPVTSPESVMNFIVRGTNATLRQSVVFTGNLQQAVFVQQMPASNQAANAAVRFQNQVPMPNQMQKSQLNGRARLANGAEVEINAVALPQDGARTP